MERDRPRAQVPGVSLHTIKPHTLQREKLPHLAHLGHLAALVRVVQAKASAGQATVSCETPAGARRVAVQCECVPLTDEGLPVVFAPLGPGGNRLCAIGGSTHTARLENLGGASSSKDPRRGLVSVIYCCVHTN